MPVYVPELGAAHPNGINDTGCLLIFIFTRKHISVVLNTIILCHKNETNCDQSDEIRLRLNIPQFRPSLTAFLCQNCQVMDFQIASFCHI